MEQNNIKLLDLPLDLLRTILEFVADIAIIRCRSTKELEREYSFIFATRKFFLIFGSSIRSLDLEYPSEGDTYGAWQYRDTMLNVDYLQYVFDILQISSGTGLKSLKLPFMPGGYLESILPKLRQSLFEFPNIRSLNIPGADEVNNATFQMVSGLRGLEELVVRDATETNLNSLTNAAFCLRYFAIFDYTHCFSRTRGLIISNLLRFTMGTVETVMLRFYVDEFSEERMNGDDPIVNLLKYIDSIVSEGKVLWNSLGIDLISNFYIPEELVHGDVLIPMKRIYDMVSIQRNTRNMSIARSELAALKITIKYPNSFFEDGINALKSCIANTKCSLEIVTPGLGVKWNTEEASYNIVGLHFATEFASFVLDEAKSMDFISTVSLPENFEGGELTGVLNISNDQTNSSLKQLMVKMVSHMDIGLPLHPFFFLHVIELFQYVTKFEVNWASISNSCCDSNIGRLLNHMSNVETILITSRTVCPMLSIRELLLMRRNFFRALPSFLRKMASRSSRLKFIILQPYEFPFDAFWQVMIMSERIVKRRVSASAFARCTAGLDIFRNSNPSIEIRTIYREVLVWSEIISSR